MGKQKDRYHAWGYAHHQAWAAGDVDAVMDTYAESSIMISMSPFGDHWTAEGKEAIREVWEGTPKLSDKKIIEIDVLSANKERGIVHGWTSWTSEDGKKWACTHIMIVHLDENDKCTKQQDWDLAKEEEAEDAG
ncbi:MAG: nuclear transport factor 2 family protein [Halieaceae bacterium]|nr:nuclear transport factor 2 family protein [Halieaceae bacterium]